MSETKPSLSAVRPEEKPTVEMDAAPKWAISLTERVNSGFAEMRVMRHDIDLLVGGISSLKIDVRDLQRWKLASEERQEQHSVRVGRESDHNLQQDSAISKLVTDVASLKETQDTQLTILLKLDKVAANPMVRRVAYAVGTAALGYLTARGMK
jgi:hypothetical protein